MKTRKKPIRTEIDDKKVMEDIKAGKGLAPLVTVADKLPEEARDQQEKRAEMARSNWAAQMEGLGYDASGNRLPEERTNGAGVTKKSVRKSAEASEAGEKQAKKPKSARAKAKQPNGRITSASILKKLNAFGKNYQIEEEQDFREAARIYSEEAELIAQMRKRLKEDGLTVMKTYKTGDCEVAHPLLSELPRHVESANKCLMTISSMIEERGAKKQKPTRELDQFRLHA